MKTLRRWFVGAYLHGIRPFLPRTGQYAILNGTPVVERRWLDTVVPWYIPPGEERNDYEQGLVTGIESTVKQGDKVVVVGGGWGVSAAVAARQVGEEGYVHIFEAGKKQIELVNKTLKINGISNRTTVVHAIVGEGIELRGSSDGASQVSPEELPACDVLVLDCEGAEVKILKNLTSLPDSVVVETHGLYGAPTDLVATELIENNYNIKSKNIAEPSISGKCIKNDVQVLTAETQYDKSFH